MTLKEFKAEAEHHIDKLEDLIHRLPQKGNTSSECQRMTLQQALNEFYYAVNGTEAKDLIEDPEEE